MDSLSCCLFVIIVVLLALVFRRLIHEEEILRSEFGNETAALKAKHRDDLEQQRFQLEEQHARNAAALLAEKEEQFRIQIESLEDKWRCEMKGSLEKQEVEFQRLQEEREAQFHERIVELEAIWSKRIDDLQKQVQHVTNEKLALEKSMKEEIQTQVQASQEKLQSLRQEAASLEAVLELRAAEVRALRQELQRAASASTELAALRERNQTLLNTVEGLQAQLQLKTNEERRLQLEVAALSSQCREEMHRSRRISMEKEQLQWRLSRHLDQSSPGASATNTSSSSSSSSLSNGDPVTGTPKSRSRGPPPHLNLSPIIKEPEETEAVEPGRAESPTVRNFLEKSASVAYELELDGPLKSPRTPLSPFFRRRNLLRFSSLWWQKSKSQ